MLLFCYIWVTCVYVNYYSFIFYSTNYAIVMFNTIRIYITMIQLKRKTIGINTMSHHKRVYFRLNIIIINRYFK